MTERDGMRALAQPWVSEREQPAGLGAPAWLHPLDAIQPIKRPLFGSPRAALMVVY